MRHPCVSPAPCKRPGLLISHAGNEPTKGPQSDTFRRGKSPQRQAAPREPPARALRTAPLAFPCSSADLKTKVQRCPAGLRKMFEGDRKLGPAAKLGPGKKSLGIGLLICRRARPQKQKTLGFICFRGRVLLYLQCHHSY